MVLSVSTSYAQIPAGTPFFSSLSVQGTSTLTGAVTHNGTSALNGATTIGTNTAAASLIANGPAASARIMQWSTAGVARWRLSTNSTAEGGSDAGSDLDLFALTDAGSVKGVALRVTRSTGALTVNPNQTFNGTQTLKVFGALQSMNDAIQGPTNLAISSGVPIAPGAASKGALYFDTNYTGTWDSGGTAPFYFRVKDAVNGEPASFIPTIWLINNEYNAGAGNGRTFVTIANNKNVNSVIPTADNTFVGFTIKGNLLANEGDSSTYRTYWGGININVVCAADYIRVCGQGEIDMGINAGLHARSVTGFAFNNNQFDGAHGDLDDNMLQFTSSPNSPASGGRAAVFQLGTALTQWPIAAGVANSAIMTIHPYTFNNPFTHNLGQPTRTTQYFASYGFDLFYLNAISAVWRSPGFSVDGGGQHSMGPTTLTYDASGNATLAVTRVREISATIGTAAGDHYKATDEIADANGGLWTVASVAVAPVGALTGVTQLQPGYASSCPGAGTSVTAGSGQLGTLNISCAPLGNLILGASTHNVQIGGGSALATNATTGMLLIPSMAGPPTGNVGALGKVALVWDSTNKKLCTIAGATVECSPAYTP